jgi:hypothetical protein
MFLEQNQCDPTECQRPELTAAEIGAQAERILASGHFRQAASLARFLRYVVDKQLAGEAHELKEYSIGVEVFQRGTAFEPGTDAVVRVQASKLRKKLERYYADEGADDSVLIELPKGHYVPKFTRRAAPSLEAPAPSAEAIATGPAAREPFPVNFVAPAPAREQWRVRLRVAAVFVAGVVCVLALQTLGGLAARSRDGAGHRSELREPALDLAAHPLWSPFLKPGASNVLAFGTPQFFNANGVYFRDVRVNSSSELNASPALLEIQKKLGQELAPAEVYTGVGEAQGVYLLSRFFFGHSLDVRVARNRLVGWEEVKNSNVILLSSLRFHTLADELAYPTDFVIAAGPNGDVINKRPQAGELAAYTRNAREDYAVVTLWPGKRAGGRVMHLSGVTTWATVAAAEYVTEPEHLRQLSRHLSECAEKRGQQGHAPYFQVLLRVEVKDNQPVGISYLTHHDLELPEERGQLARR